LIRNYATNYLNQWLFSDEGQNHLFLHCEKAVAHSLGACLLDMLCHD